MFDRWKNELVRVDDLKKLIYNPKRQLMKIIDSIVQFFIYTVAEETKPVLK